MGRYGLGTRIAMIVLGTIWAVAGAAWLFHLHRGATPLFDDSDNGIATIPLALLIGGLILLKTGLAPDRPRTFEDEIPDAHPDLETDGLLSPLTLLVVLLFLAVLVLKGVRYLR